MKKCVQCSGEKWENSDVPVSRTIAGCTFSAEVTGRRCLQCGARYAGQHALELFDQMVARDLAESGVASGEAVRFMRKVIGVSAKEWADLLGVTPETVSRWENDQRAIDPTALRMLRAATLDRFHGHTTTVDKFRQTLTTRTLGAAISLGRIVDAA